jgi:putative nucleotidyltransferase with HDIG domain
MNREEALLLLGEYVTSTSLRSHCIATAAVMRATAAALGEDEERWEVIGILHDIDFEGIGEDMARHGIEGERILLENGVDPEIAAIVRRHNHMLHGDGYEAPVEIALQAADSVSGLVVACALVKGGKITEVTPKTVKKKFKEKAFAAGCERDRILLIEPLLDLPTFYQVAIDGIVGVKEELGLS